MSILLIFIGCLIGVFLMALIKSGSMAEKDSLVYESRKSLNNAENLAADLTKENKYLHNEIRDCRNKKDKLKNVVQNIYDLASYNNYNNINARLNKIIEVIKSANINNF